MTENHRRLEELSDVQLSNWTSEELMHHHRSMSDLSPWLNSQGSSLHHQIIDEIMRRNSSD
ncbi:hypothetical protein [Marinicrinis lubricantis]|uniref:Uncharacterized protein n=1 Tax=Marinicrinis lubricantis TaxID=2086470 RepID=A0ABW1IR64_9BACL